MIALEFMARDTRERLSLHRSDEPHDNLKAVAADAGFEVPAPGSAMAKELARGILAPMPGSSRSRCVERAELHGRRIAHATVGGTARICRCWLKATVGGDQALQRRKQGQWNHRTGIDNEAIFSTFSRSSVTRQLAC